MVMVVGVCSRTAVLVHVPRPDHDGSRCDQRILMVMAVIHGGIARHGVGMAGKVFARAGRAGIIMTVTIVIRRHTFVIMRMH